MEEFHHIAARMEVKDLTVSFQRNRQDQPLLPDVQTVEFLLTAAPMVDKDQTALFRHNHHDQQLQPVPMEVFHPIAVLTEVKVPTA